MDRVDYQPLIVQDLVNWHQHDELDLTPWYQRRSVWTRPQKAYLLNTIFEQKPIPTLYFRHTVDLERDQSMREVVDGQQRIRSILEYINGEFRARHPDHRGRVHYESLTVEQKRRFRETQLSGGWLLGANESDVIEVFGRLNSVAKTLNTAEKRNALFSGEFKQFCLLQGAQRLPIWRDLAVFTANDIARMQEIEFVADLARNYLEGLSDFSGSRLNKLYEQYDEDFPEASALKRRLDVTFSKIADLPATTIRDTIFSRVPLFFSLMVVLDELSKMPSTKQLQLALVEIDERFNSDTPLSERPKDDAAFVEACRASTQRIATRRVRHRYIKRFLS